MVAPLANLLAVLMPLPTRSKRSHLDYVCLSVTQAPALLLPPGVNRFLTSPTVSPLLSNGHAHALKKVKVFLYTPLTLMDSTASGSKIQEMEVRVSDSQTGTVTDMPLLFERISTSHLATTLPPVSMTTRTIWLSQPRVTALRAGFTFLTCSMRFTGTLPNLPTNGLRDKESSLSFSPMVTQLATVSMVTLYEHPSPLFQYQQLVLTYTDFWMGCSNSPTNHRQLRCWFSRYG